jgi:hypothetical protein
VSTLCRPSRSSLVLCLLHTEERSRRRLGRTCRHVDDPLSSSSVLTVPSFAAIGTASLSIPSLSLLPSLLLVLSFSCDGAVSLASLPRSLPPSPLPFPPLFSLPCSLSLSLPLLCLSYFSLLCPCPRAVRHVLYSNSLEFSHGLEPAVLAMRMKAGDEVFYRIQWRMWIRISRFRRRAGRDTTGAGRRWTPSSLSSTPTTTSPRPPPPQRTRSPLQRLQGPRETYAARNSDRAPSPSSCDENTASSIIESSSCERRERGG